MLVTAVLSLSQLAMILVTSTTATHKTLAQKSLKSSTAAFLSADAYCWICYFNDWYYAQLEATHTSMLTTVWR